jgi:colicin import membrane protein
MLPPAADSRDGLFRRMLLVSGAFHVGALVLSAAWGDLPARHPRLPPVAVVDLVGAPARPQAPPARAPSPPQRAEPAPPPRAEPAPQPPPAARKERAAAAVPAPQAAPPAVEPSAPVREPSAANDDALAERIRRMREERTASDRIREAARMARQERELQQAIGGIRERVAHRVDLTAARPAPRGAAASREPMGAEGAAGTVRLSPEHMAYFRALDERIRSSWVNPVKNTEDLMVVVAITIERDGRVSDVRMERTSGNPFFDDSVRRAIRKASPLPVPPEQLRGGESYYEVGFRFFGEEDLS